MRQKPLALAGSVLAGWVPAGWVLAGWVIAAGLLLQPLRIRAAECRFERNLPVDPQGSLEAVNGSGNIKIVAGEDRAVHVTGAVRAERNWFGEGATQAEVDRVCRDPPIRATGSTVHVGPLPSELPRHITVDYFIQVPRLFYVAATSSSGDLGFGGLGGPVKAQTGSGDVRASNLAGGARLDTGSGDIDATGLSGYTQLHTASGGIRARFSGPGDVRAESSSGDVHLDEVRGSLQAHAASGEIEVSGRPTGDWRIETASGNVRLHVGAGTGFSLDAQASSGDVGSSLPLAAQEGEDREHSFHGKVAGGGPAVQVNTASGDIRVD